MGTAAAARKTTTTTATTTMSERILRRLGRKENGTTTMTTTTWWVLTVMVISSFVSLVIPIQLIRTTLILEQQATTTKETETQIETETMTTMRRAVSTTATVSTSTYPSKNTQDQKHQHQHQQRQSQNLLVGDEDGNIVENNESRNDEHNRYGNCSIVIENKSDFHYEILESIALRFPLPWKDLAPTTTTTTSTSIDGSNGGGGGGEEEKSFTNRCFDPKTQIVYVDIAVAPASHRMKRFDGEQESWVQYYRSHLQHTKHVRPTDGWTIQFRDLVDYTDYGARTYHAYISSTIDLEKQVRKRLRKDNERRIYAVCHGVLDKVPAHFRNRTCWLSPMYEDDCNFLPLDLPRIDPCDHGSGGGGQQQQQQQVHDDSDGNGDNYDDSFVTICTSGNGRDYALLGNGLKTIANNNYHNNTTGHNNVPNVRLLIFMRDDKFHAEAQKQFTEWFPTRATVQQSIIQNVTTTYERDYYEFHKTIVQQCDVYLPLIDPYTQPSYFPPEIHPPKPTTTSTTTTTTTRTTTSRKLSGGMAILLAYRPFLATAVPYSVYQIYKNYFSVDGGKARTDHDRQYGFRSFPNTCGIGSDVGKDSHEDDDDDSGDFLYKVYKDPYPSNLTTPYGLEYESRQQHMPSFVDVLVPLLGEAAKRKSRKKTTRKNKLLPS